MLSKNKLKLFNSLKLRKYRKKHRLFSAEGEKIVFDLMKSDFVCKYLICENNFKIDNTVNFGGEHIITDMSEMKKISNLKTPPSIIGIFETKYDQIETTAVETSLSVFTDDIQDPGNLGTIIRSADWFGIKNIICSNNTADVYNPKTIQATMGALAGTCIMYADTDEFFTSISSDLPVYGTYMTGKDIYTTELSKKGIIVLGNEGKGISKKTGKFVKQKLCIPSSDFPVPVAESLNVSSAASVIFSEFNRRIRYKK